MEPIGGDGPAVTSRRPRRLPPLPSSRVHPLELNVASLSIPTSHHQPPPVFQGRDHLISNGGPPKSLDGLQLRPNEHPTLMAAASPASVQQAAQEPPPTRPAQPSSAAPAVQTAEEQADVEPKGLRGYLCHYIFDASTDVYYYWTIIMSLVYIYNLVVAIARWVFKDLDSGFMWIIWLGVDILCDAVYILDMLVRSRTGYLEQGLLVREKSKIWTEYRKSKQFMTDVGSLIPVDHLLHAALNGPIAVLRLNRLLRLNRIADCMERTETRSAFPNVFRVCVVVFYIVIIIHWNACFYFLISTWIGLGTDTWVYGSKNKQSLPDGVSDTLVRRYIYSFYWSTLTLTTIGEVPGPVENIEFFFVTADLMGGVLIFATIVGNVGSMISNMSAARAEFQNKMDGIKQYMELRKVSKQLEMRVIKWFDYLWANKQSLSDETALKVLPDKLQAEISMHVHFETLRKVRIFQDCESGLLAELVLKLQLQVFSPGDYICRKGDIGREMYIVKRGRLHVVGDDGSTVLGTLLEGSVFGELSILNIAGSKNGNRRTANVRSVGYTDLFVLNKNELWTALKEYPEARKLLLAKGRELLTKDGLLEENAPEDQSTPEELVEQLLQTTSVLQTRMARLIAEKTNTETKLNDRIKTLEGQLTRYKNMIGKQPNILHPGSRLERSATSDAENSDHKEERTDLLTPSHAKINKS